MTGAMISSLTIIHLPAVLSQNIAMALGVDVGLVCVLANSDGFRHAAFALCSVPALPSSCSQFLQKARLTVTHSLSCRECIACFGFDPPGGFARALWVAVSSHSRIHTTSPGLGMQFQDRTAKTSGEQTMAVATALCHEAEVLGQTHGNNIIRKTKYTLQSWHCGGTDGRF